MKYVWRLTDFLLYSNIFVAICASILVLGYYAVDSSVSIDYSYIIIVFLSTVSIYSFHRWFSFSPEKSKVFNIRNEFIRKTRPFLLLYSVLTGTTALAIFILSRKYAVCTAIPPVVLSTLYLIPFYKNKRLRDFSYIKIYIVSAVWAWIAVIFPAENSSWELWEKLTLSGGQFFLVFGLILPQDYRDRQKDSADSMRSYAHKFSLSQLKKTGIYSFLISITLQLLLVFHQTIHLHFAAGYLIGVLLAILLTLKYSGNEHDYFYTGLIDGILLIQGGMLLLISLFIPS